MNSVVAHIVSGFSFFSGTALVVLGIFLRNRATRSRCKACCSIAAIVGLLLAALSGNPASYFILFILSGLGTASCSNRLTNAFPRLVSLSVTCWVLALAAESRWFITPQVPLHVAAKNLPIIVLADSMTAGLGENEATTWPVLLKQKYTGPIMDLSHVGETFGSATKRIQQRTLPDNAIVIIELGGNDILGSTAKEDFKRDIERLLASTSGAGRYVYMFELPLLPFHNEWGQIQRNLAAKHAVQLIPKYRLISVIAGPSSTLDSIHLTQQGHERMLRVVSEVLRLPISQEP